MSQVKATFWTGVMETAKTSCNGTGTEANHDGEGKSTADDKKARMINKLVDFYTAAAAAGLIQIDPESLRAAVQESNWITDGFLDPDTFTRVLECPICYQICLPPVCGCVNGHILCGSCQKAHLDACSRLPPDTPPPLYTCPVCRNPYFPVPMPYETRVMQMLLKDAPKPPKKAEA